jgi:hypothetical protein
VGFVRFGQRYSYWGGRDTDRFLMLMNIVYLSLFLSMRQENKDLGPLVGLAFNEDTDRSG